MPPLQEASRLRVSCPHRRAAALLALIGLAGCGSIGSISKPVTLHQEGFASTTTYSRSFETSTAQVCEAARRALLSQGYVINAATAEIVTGRKSFQPDSEVHIELDFRISCVAEGGTGQRTIAFVSALQDRYALKKSNNSASLGVPALGSVSLPFSSSDDALVKVASETLTAERFYDGFFQLLQRYLVVPAAPAPEAAASEPAGARAATSRAPL